MRQERLLRLIKHCCTPDTPIVSGGQFPYCVELFSDLLQDSGGASVPIQSVKTWRLKQAVRVFNITVTGTNTYYIGTHKVLVHNKNV